MITSRRISDHIKAKYPAIVQKETCLLIIFMIVIIYSSCSQNIIITPKTAVNLRNQPSVSEGKIIRVLHVGERLKYIEQPNEWIKVETEENIVGWVHSKYVEEMKMESGGKKLRKVTSTSYLRMRISESWDVIQNYAVIFYVILFITLGVIISNILGFHPGIGVTAGIACYLFANMTVVSFRMNMLLFAAINAGIGLTSSAISGIILGKNADENPINYLIGIVGPIGLAIYGIFPGLSQIFIIYICVLMLGIMLNMLSIRDFLEDTMKYISAIPTVIVLMIIISIFSVFHMPKIWLPLIYIQSAMGILGFIAGKNS